MMVCQNSYFPYPEQSSCLGFRSMLPSSPYIMNVMN